MSRLWPDSDDPCLVLQRKQEQTCAGCDSFTTQTYLGVRKFVCGRGRQKASTEIQEMRRCRAYVESAPTVTGQKMCNTNGSM